MFSEGKEMTEAEIVLPPSSTVVQCKKEKFDIYVGRPSKHINRDIIGSDGFWGNPFSIELDEFGKPIAGSRERVIEQFRDWLLNDHEKFYDNPTRSNFQVRLKLIELKGKVLGCWCYPLPCHAIVLTKLANSIMSKEDIDNWWIEEEKKIKPWPDAERSFYEAHTFTTEKK